MTADPEKLRDMPTPTYESGERMCFPREIAAAADGAIKTAFPGVEVTPLETIYYSGRAWRVDLDNIRYNVVGEPDAIVDWWLIEAPWAHHFWHSYSLMLMHLQPLRGVPPPHIYLPHATHEMVLQAISPDAKRSTFLEAGFNNDCMPLSPANFAAQSIYGNDTEARQRIEDTVHDVCDGKLNPDTDFMRQWIERFGDNMVKGRARKN